MPPGLLTNQNTTMLTTMRTTFPMTNDSCLELFSNEKGDSSLLKYYWPFFCLYVYVVDAFLRYWNDKMGSIGKWSLLQSSNSDSNLMILFHTIIFFFSFPLYSVRLENVGQGWKLYGLITGSIQLTSRFT